jgi:hypothetical protein
MEELFGELRGLLGARVGYPSVMEARSPSPSIERKERARRRDLVAALERAHALDPRRYEEEWLPHLRRADLPAFPVRTLDEAAAMRAFMPPEVFDIAWVLGLGSTTGSSWASDERLGHVTDLTLHLDHDGSYARSIRDLLGSPYLVNLRRLTLRAYESTYNKVRTSTADAVLRGLAKSEAVRGLEHLGFHTFPSTHKAWELFAASAAAASLESLELEGPFCTRDPLALAAASLGARGVALEALRLDCCDALDVEVLRSPALARLESLELLFTEAADALEAMAASTSVHPLRRLVATCGAEAASALMRSGWLAEAREVELDLPEWGPRMDAGALLAYLEVAPESQVTSLTLTRFGAPDAETLAALAAWPGLRRTTSLGIFGGALDVGGLVALLGSPHAANITALDLTGSPLSPEAARALAGAPGLERLTSLNLNGCLGDEAAALAIARSPHLGALSRLEVRGRGFTGAAMSALRERHPARGLEVVAGPW